MQNYLYDELNRLINVNDMKQDVFDEIFAYDAQGRIVAQRRDTSIAKNIGGEYAYYANTNRLKSVADGMGGNADKRDMSASDNFEYDAEGNMTKDYSKDLAIAYDWRGMPVEFKRQNSCYDIHEKIVCDSTKLEIKYDGSGRRISKTRMMKTAADGDWYVNNVTRYTGIGTEVRESYFGGALDNAKVVMNLPEGLGRYTPEDAVDGFNGVGANQRAGYRPPAKFEWYLKNHIGSTMLVYGTSAYNSKWEAVEGFKDKPDAGPLPAGKYTIGPIEKNHNGKLWAMMLIPDPENEMYGRKDFMIHGAHPNDHFDSYEGCMIFGPDVRKKIGASGDNNLIVVPDAIEDIQPDGHVEIGDIDIE